MSSRSFSIEPTTTPVPVTKNSTSQIIKDPHSFSNPHQIRVRHIDLKLTVSFEERTLHGTAVLMLERLVNDVSEVVLDTLQLDITKVECSSWDNAYQAARFQFGDNNPVLGTAMKIALPNGADRVRIEYSTKPDARALQWLEPQHTAGKTDPFLLTQSQIINARSWLPLQDSPQVRMTFRAAIQCPEHLMAVMGAANNPQSLDSGQYFFEMPQSIPSYLMALAVGKLSFSPLSSRTGVYAEESVIDAAAAEFTDIEVMMQKIEKLYGPYRWDRYDILVLPPSFPVGGMENPRLTFATSTILAGDKSLVSLIAHEAAHSWAGNLVTNATWNDFWLNEGFSVYVERRVIEEVYGKRRAEMEASLGWNELQGEMARLSDSEEILHANCNNRDPEDCITLIPYEKGALFLLQLEKTFGRSRFDSFLRSYFDHFAFQSVTTTDFVDYLQQNLLGHDETRANSIPLTEWLYEPGIPSSAPKPSSEVFSTIEADAQAWLEGRKSASELDASFWTVHEWLHFLKCLPFDLSLERLVELDRTFKLTSSQNSEIAHQWLLMAIRAGYDPAVERLEEFLLSVGREKLIKPLYEELVKSPGRQQWAREVYTKARSSYNPIVIRKLDQLLHWKEQ